MQSGEKRVRETLEQYGETWDESVWKVQGQPVIYHKTVERLAGKAGVVFEEPTIIRAEADEAVILVRGRLGERWDYDIGEARLGVNYRVSGKMAAYLWSMALKRGRDRLILKLIGIHGLVYSEDESDDFRRPTQRAKEAEPEPDLPAMPEFNLGSISVNGERQRQRLSAYAARKQDLWQPLIDSLRACPDMPSLTHWSEFHAEELEKLPANWLEEVRSEWKARAQEIKSVAK